jgi:hypothetical protein
MPTRGNADVPYPNAIEYRERLVVWKSIDKGKALLVILLKQCPLQNQRGASESVLRRHHEIAHNSGNQQPPIEPDAARKNRCAADGFTRCRVDYQPRCGVTLWIAFVKPLTPLLNDFTNANRAHAFSPQASHARVVARACDPRVVARQRWLLHRHGLPIS